MKDIIIMRVFLIVWFIFSFSFYICNRKNFKNKRLPIYFILAIIFSVIFWNNSSTQELKKLQINFFEFFIWLIVIAFLAFITLEIKDEDEQKEEKINMIPNDSVITNKIDIARRENKYTREDEKEFNRCLYAIGEYDSIPFSDFIEFCYAPYFSKFKDNAFVRIDTNITVDTEELRRIICGIKEFAKTKGFIYFEKLVKSENNCIILKFKR